MKTIFDTRDVDMAAQSEVQWMQRARHPRLILFFGMGKQPLSEGGNIFIAIEFMKHGDLLAKLETRDREIQSWKLRMRLLEDVALGMQYIHSVLNSIHRDLKSENVLLDYEAGTLRAKIADFGLSRIVPKKKESEPKRSTLNLFRSNTGRNGGNASSVPDNTSSTSSFSSLHFTNAAMTSAKGTVAYVVWSSRILIVSLSLVITRITLKSLVSLIYITRSLERTLECYARTQVHGTRIAHQESIERKRRHSLQSVC